MKTIKESRETKNYKCYNCGFVREIIIPCNSCGDVDVYCPFCGEAMTRVWEALYNE